MTKEQQALDELRDLIHSELDGTRMLDEYLKHCDTLQELVDKATPKKVVPQWHKGYDPKLYYPKSFHCPSCGRKLRIDQFYKWCPDCNQALEKWSDEDDK